MAKILYLAQYLEKLSQAESQKEAERQSLINRNEAERARNLAKQFIFQASSLLNDLNEEDRRIGWLLSDCAQLLDSDTECQVVL